MSDFFLSLCFVSFRFSIFVLSVFDIRSAFFLLFDLGYPSFLPSAPLANLLYTKLTFV